MDTDSTETLKNADYQLVVKMKDAVLIKNLINSLKEENQEYIFENDIEEINENYIVKTFSGKDILRHIFLSISPIVTLIQIGLVMFPIIFDEQAKISLPIVFLVILVYLGIFITRQLNRINNLTITRKTNEIDISYGFLTTEHFSVPINKIQSLESEQSFFARVFNYKIYKINAVGVGNEKEESNILNVYLKSNEADKNLKDMLPEFKIESNFIPQNINYIKYLSIIYLIVALIFSTILVYNNYFWISLIFDLILIIAIILQLKYNYISLQSDRIVIKRGLFSVLTRTVYYEKIDTITIHQNILSKIFKIQKLKVTFRGKTGKDNIYTGYFKEGFFDKIVEFYRNGEKNKAE